MPYRLAKAMRAAILTLFVGSLILHACAEEPPIALGRSATFEARHELKINVPEGVKKLGVWFVLPQELPAQKVSGLKIEAPYPYRTTKDSEGNSMLYMEVEQPKEKQLAILCTFMLTRFELNGNLDQTKARALTDAEREKLAPYLGPNKNIVINDKIKELANQIVGGEQNTIRAARKIYDWELANVDYWVKDPATKKASPVGSSEYCLTTKTGNCTDFNSLWTALARAKGIPTRMFYGSFFKAELDGKDIDNSYHCWLEFYAGGIGWIPHDVAVANIFIGEIKLTKENLTLVSRSTADGYKGPDPLKVEYYFGNLDERRVTWSTGRDLILEPKQQGEPVNAMIKAYVEVDGLPLAENKETGWARKLTYTEKK